MSGFEANAGSNPWDFILMLEGSLLFAGALGRKLDDDRAPSARFPFLVNSSPVGLGHHTLGESSGREAWLPVWDKPTSLEEIAAIFSEGRIEKHGRIARSGTDAFVALAQHGHSSGIAAFQRIGFFKGRIGGDNYFTAVDQGVFRSRRNQRVDLLKDIDEWLDKLQDTVQRDQCPKAVSSAVVQVEARIADLALNGSTDSLQAVLVSLVRPNALWPRACSGVSKTMFVRCVGFALNGSKMRTQIAQSSVSLHRSLECGRVLESARKRFGCGNISNHWRS